MTASQSVRRLFPSEIQHSQRPLITVGIIAWSYRRIIIAFALAPDPSFPFISGISSEMNQRIRVGDRIGPFFFFHSRMRNGKSEIIPAWKISARVSNIKFRYYRGFWCNKRKSLKLGNVIFQRDSCYMSEFYFYRSVFPCSYLSLFNLNSEQVHRQLRDRHVSVQSTLDPYRFYYRFHSFS